MPNVLSPRDLVFRPDNMDETVLHTYIMDTFYINMYVAFDASLNCRNIHMCVSKV